MTTDIGLLFIQLGTPDAPTTRAVRRYLAEFLSDPRVVDFPRFLWMPILHGIILRTRPKKSAKLYQRIWRDDGVSPLLHHTLNQVQHVKEQLSPRVKVRLAMRYGRPRLQEVINEMLAEGVEKLLVFPLFPQYSSATTGTAMEAVLTALSGRRLLPTLRFAPPFFADPGYITALASQVKTAVHAEHAPFFLFSFHGLPRRYVNAGDPYATHCTETAHCLAKKMGIPENRWQITYQSRFGPEEWLLPATNSQLKQLPKAGHKHLAIVCPGFTADCLETLEEIAQTGRQLFLTAGGESCQYVPCLNESPEWLTALTAMAHRELAGWLP